MSNLKNWSTIAASNNAAPPDGAPENTMKWSQVNDWMRETHAALRRQHEQAQWIDYGHSTSFVNAASFRINGSDQRTVYADGRRLRASVGVGNVVGSVLSSTFAGGDTTVVVALDSGAIDSSITGVAVGILTPSGAGLTRPVLGVPPNDLRYVMAPGGSQSGAAAARILVAGPGISLSDAGAGGNLELLAQGYRLLRTVYYTTPGADNWTMSAAVAIIDVEVLGGGGAGGYADASANAIAVGTGGAAGGWGRKRLTAASLSAIVPLNIGSAGAAGSVSGVGGAGGDSTFGTYLGASGGGGGTYGQATSLAGMNTGIALGGSFSGADIGKVGGNGGLAWQFAYAAGVGKGVNGIGGDSQYGKGGRAFPASTSAGDPGSGYGSGGSGGVDHASGADRAPGAGASGIIIVTEYTGSP